MKRHRVWLQPLAVLVMTAFFFLVLYYGDNKYYTPPPYGKSGVLRLSGADLERKNPVFLIDGWLLTDGRVTDKPTYIGEFSNLQRGDLAVSPHGQARYQLTLCYDGAERVVSVDFPQLYSGYSVWLDGVRLDRGTGSGRITFLLTEGEHILSGYGRDAFAGGKYPGFRLCVRLSDSVGVGGIYAFSVAHGRASGTLVWVVVLQLCTVCGAVFCVSAVVFCFLFHGNVLVFAPKFCNVCFVFLCRAAYGFGIRRRIWQSVAAFPAAFDCASGCLDGAGAFDSGTALGGFCPWQDDGFLLCRYFLCVRFFLCAEHEGAGLGKPLYDGRLYGVRGWAARQSFLFQPF